MKKLLVMGTLVFGLVFGYVGMPSVLAAEEVTPSNTEEVANTLDDVNFDLNPIQEDGSVDFGHTIVKRERGGGMHQPKKAKVKLTKKQWQCLAATLGAGALTAASGGFWFIPQSALGFVGSCL